MSHLIVFFLIKQMMHIVPSISTSFRFIKFKLENKKAKMNLNLKSYLDKRANFRSDEFQFEYRAKNVSRQYDTIY